MKTKNLLFLGLYFLMQMHGIAQINFTEYVCNVAGYSIPQGMIEYNGKTYFSALDTIYGDELWVTDGTKAGTHVVKDIEDGSMGSDPHGFTVFNNKLYFNAHTDVFGNELWCSDGTAAGTVMVKDIVLGNGQGSNPSELTVFNGKLYFSAFDMVNGDELWSTDGTVAGTQLVKDINTAQGMGNFNSYPTHFKIYNGALYFLATDTIHGTEIWLTNGTSSGTQLLKDINPGIASSSVSEFTELNGKLFFAAIPNATCGELWVTDGTSNGTVSVKTLYCSPPQKPTHLTAYNGKLYFAQESNQYGSEPWISDGTSAGTQLLKDISWDMTASTPNNFIPYSGKLYFIASDTASTSLWSTDGTTAGTQLASVIYTNHVNVLPESIVAYGGKLYFIASSSATTTDYQVFQSDGTNGGTHNISPSSATHSNPLNPLSLDFTGLKLCNNQLFFAAYYNSDDIQLWSINDLALGIEERAGSRSFEIYPNPTSNQLVIEGLPNKTPLVITNIVGETMLKTEVSEQIQKVDISVFAPGLYFLNNKKFVKQ
jgi:ELWxxDGT repeat protein